VVIDVVSLRESLGSRSDEDIVAGVHYWNPWINSLEAAREWLWSIIFWLLYSGEYRAAIHLIWGSDLFDSRPNAVKTLFHAIDSAPRIIVLGGSSMGKTYGSLGYLICDYLVDPEWTAIRFLSVTGGHAMSGVFSQMQRFWEEACWLTLPGESQRGYIGLDTKDRWASVQVVSVQQGEYRSALVGFHPIRRTMVHPVFGGEGRVRVACDEAEMAGQSGSLWPALENVAGNIDEPWRVKNPYDVTSRLATEAEPECGWARVDPDKHFMFMAKSGWLTVRLDPKFSENIQQRRKVYGGFKTHIWYESQLAKYGGKGREFMCYERGCYDVSGALNALVPPSYLTQLYGELIFAPGTEVGIGGLDIAFEHDRCVLCAGRFGRAAGWRPAGRLDVIYFSAPQWSIQIDNFFVMPKLPTLAQYKAVRAKCLELNIDFSFFALDSTGVGLGLSDAFRENNYPVYPINWGSGATHTKVLQSDTGFCDERYDGISSELHFAFYYLLQADGVKCLPTISYRAEMEKGICNRKTARSGRMGPTGIRLAKVEEKKDFISREGSSPDFSDAMLMTCQVARVLGPERVALTKRAAMLRPKVVPYEDFSATKTLSPSDD
jgi:hypothetical protein